MKDNLNSQAPPPFIVPHPPQYYIHSLHILISGNPLIKPNEIIISDFYKSASQNTRSEALCAPVERF